MISSHYVCRSGVTIMESMERYTVVLTGASGEIGKKVLEGLLLSDYRVIAQTTRLGNLQEFASYQNIKIIESDLSKIEDCKNFVINIKQASSSIHAFIAIAGINRDQLLINMKDEDWQRVMDLNLSTNFYLIRELLPLMLKNRYGRIVAISSVAAAIGNSGQANYCASKAGLEGLIRTVASEYAKKGITANCVAPGFVKSKMTAKMNQEALAKALQRVPMGRMAEPEEIAAVVKFLASKESSYVTGQTWQVNGGIFFA